MTPQEQIDFVIGPQVPIGDSYFDRTQVERAKVFGAVCPAKPPADTDAAVVSYDNTTATFNNFQYYDLPQCLYNTARRTGDLSILANAQKAADSFWMHPTWIGGGTIKKWEQGEATPPPRHAGIGGLILRALDGKPEYWPWIVGYAQAASTTWLRVNNASLHYGVREGAFALHYMVFISQTLPDSFPNAAQIRSQLLADAENAAINYYGRLQFPDGSWRWDAHEFVDSDGGTLKGIMQPFMVGLLLSALIDLHLVTSNPTVKTKVGDMIVRACRHLYLDGPYAKTIKILNFKGGFVRGFHYFYHGGTTVNPARYANGDIPQDWMPEAEWWIASARQAIAEIVHAFGYAKIISGDPTFVTAGDELWNSAYGGEDGYRALMGNNTPKNWNQHVRRAGSYLAWRGPTAVPPEPTQPLPIPPEPIKTPSPDGTKSTTIIDSELVTWTLGPQQQTLRDGVHAGGGQATQYKYLDKIVNAYGDVNKTENRNWYKWANSSWSSVGTTEPGAKPPDPEPPDPQPEPPPVTLPPRSLPWPKQTAKQNALLDAQWKERYRHKATDGATAQFVHEPA